MMLPADDIVPEGGDEDESEGAGRPRERQFNPWRRARTDRAKAFVAEVVRVLEDHEARHGLRKRARRAGDRRTMLAAVDAIASDLLHRHLIYGSEGSRVHISRARSVLSTPSRYRPPFYGGNLPAVLDVLASPDVGIIEQEIGEARGPFSASDARRTVIRAGHRMVALAGSCGVTRGDFIEDDGLEVLVLKRALTGFWDEGGAIEYDDTDATRRFRSEVREINDWLASADLDALDPREGRTAIDLSDRRLRRIFSRGSFDSGGRLFGGFWQGMSSERRLRSIFIGGDEIAELDFGQMGPRIIYGLVGAPLPPDDLYGVRPFEGHRSGIKRLFGAMTFHEGPLARFPKETNRLFPKGTKVADVSAAVAAAHPAIAHLFGTGIGHHVQTVESRIMVDLMLSLKGMGVVGLPIHDALLIPMARTDEVRSLMLETFRTHTGGIPGEVSIEM